MMAETTYSVGVDVGGTFTDIFVFNEATGTVSTAKVPTTPPDPSRGTVEGIARILDDFAAIRTIVHGTTTGTNALLERKGARTGIITTEGFRDILAMRRRDRPTTWGLTGTFTPVVERANRVEVAERTLASGDVLDPVDPAEVEARARELLAQGCEAACVFFVNGYANDENERRAVAAVRKIWPNAYVTAATEILPEIREFERLSTAALNAYLQPVVSSYLDRLHGSLRTEGFKGDLLIVQSNGGLMSVGTAQQFPVRIALSGPAAGVIAASAIASAAGFPDIITADLGGTSFDVSLITGGAASLAAQAEVDFGMVIRTPMIEITTIGAGGGSIAWIDRGGLLQVGPESAGSDPGPVCYGLGNDRPTLTDANLVLGRINPDRPIGGKIDRLDMAAARRSIATRIGAPLGLGVEDAAEAILRVADAKMAGTIRLVSIERGYEPGKFAMMPFGGGGSLHACALVREIGLKAALIPRFPGVTSALGCVVADMRHDRVRTINRPLADIDTAALDADMRATADDLEAVVRHAGVPFRSVERLFELDMLYVGQTHTVAVPVQLGAGALDHAEIRSAFESAYRAIYGRLLEGVPTRVMNFRASVIGRRPDLDMRIFAPTDGKPADRCVLGTRNVYANGTFQEATIYDRMALGVGVSVAGPAILEQKDTTILVENGFTATVDPFGNLVLTRDAQP